MSWYSDMRAMQEAAEDCRQKAMETDDEAERARLLKKAETYDRDAYCCWNKGNEED